ncbi:MAG TPA: SLC13 family permease [Candidatus Hypogeohydataceae bacterium YC38]
MDKYLSLFIFIACYAGFIFLPRLRPHCACAGALLLILLGVVGPKEAFFAVNWNVMGIFVGTLVIAELFIFSRVPAYLAELLVNRAGSACWAMLSVCGLTSFISIFAANVATVLIVAPVAIAIAKRQKISSAPFIISLAICSNLQGTATLIGDPPSMILAGYMRMTFDDFFFYHGKPSIFFAVELGALASFVVLYLFFRGYRQPVEVIEVERVWSWVPTWLLVLLMVALALSSSLDPDFGYSMAGVICMVFGLIGLAWYKVVQGGEILRLLRMLDWHTTFFLIGVFILVDSIRLAGWIHDIEHFMRGISGGNLLNAFLFMVWLSVLFSAFIDNIPYLLTMIPVAQELAKDIEGSHTLLVFGLLVGTCLGGNVTPIGASANIVAIGLLRRDNIHVSFTEFMKIGLPFTLAAVAAASAFLWLVWA